MSSGKGRTFTNGIFLFWRGGFLQEVLRGLRDDSAKKSAGIFPRYNDRYFRINGSDEEVPVPSCQGIVSQYLLSSHRAPASHRVGMGRDRHGTIGGLARITIPGVLSLPFLANRGFVHTSGLVPGIISFLLYPSLRSVVHAGVTQPEQTPRKVCITFCNINFLDSEECDRADGRRQRPGVYRSMSRICSTVFAARASSPFAGVPHPQSLRVPCTESSRNESTSAQERSRSRIHRRGTRQSPGDQGRSRATRSPFLQTFFPGSRRAGSSCTCTGENRQKNLRAVRGWQNQAHRN